MLSRKVVDSGGRVEYNRANREPGRLLVNGCTEPWHDEFVVIGTNGGGDAWYIPCNTVGSEVFQFDHERGEFRSWGWTLRQHAQWLAPGE